MKKDKIERITRIVIALSIAGIVIADLFFAYYMERHNAAGLMTFGYTTNLVFLFMFSCPVVLALVSSVEFIKEMILLKNGEGERKKRMKKPRSSFSTTGAPGRSGAVRQDPSLCRRRRKRML